MPIKSQNNAKYLQWFVSNANSVCREKGDNAHQE